MKDHYPALSTIPRGALVAPEGQPEYADDPPYAIDPTANLGTMLSDAQVDAGFGDTIATLDAGAGASRTYLELAVDSTRVAKALVAEGVRPGDRVVVRSPNQGDGLVAMIGAWKAGAVVVPTPVQAREMELRFFLEDVVARVLLVVGELEESDAVRAAAEATGVPVLGLNEAAAAAEGVRRLRLDVDGDVALPVVDADSVAVLWHTGGTTGRPKACYHSHRRFLLGGYAAGEVLRPSRGQRWAAAAPIGHALGVMYYTIYTLLHGATAVLVTDFRSAASCLDALESCEVNVFTAIMATWAALDDALIQRPRELPRLRQGYAMWQTASAATVREHWLQRGITLLNNYGSTAFATWPLVPALDEDVPAGSLGRPIPGYQVRVVSKGEESGLADVAAGPGQMAVRGYTGLTYWNRPELQARDVVDGWTLCDDVIEFDDAGCAAYLGRTDFIISTAGYKVVPGEVEQALSTHPAVREVAVVGGPDPIRHEVVVAFVCLQSGVSGDAALTRQLQDLVKERVAPYKYPRRIYYVDALPRDPVGKIRTALIKEWAAQLAADEPAQASTPPGGDAPASSDGARSGVMTR